MSTTSPLDLLRETRLAQGQPDPAQQAANRRALVLRGALLGAGLVAASAVITALLLLRQQQQQRELERLTLVEAEVQAAEARLTAARGRVNGLKRVNKALVQGLVAARSGSALLRDLQRRVPQGVQLTTIDVAPGGQTLRLLGTASDPQGFARINALQIELGRSPLLDPTGVRLIKAARGEGVGFELTAPFRPPLPPGAELQLLRELGATGMALRLQRLQAEGLLP
jgi:type IV pilus assembly protein PilN